MHDFSKGEQSGEWNVFSINKYSSFDMFVKPAWPRAETHLLKDRSRASDLGLL